VDEKYLELIDEVFKDPISRFKLVQNVGQYYENDYESNTVLHLMIYIWTMKRFGVHPSTVPEGIPYSNLYDCTEDLIKEFTPGS
jgi:hypothetical protein